MMTLEKLNQLKDHLQQSLAIVIEELGEVQHHEEVAAETSEPVAAATEEIVAAEAN